MYMLDLLRPLDFEPVYSYNYWEHGRLKQQNESTYTLEIPGILKENVSVELLNNKTLVISCNKGQAKYKESLRSNRPIKDVDAKLELGILTLKLEFDEPESRKIEIK